MPVFHTKTIESILEPVAQQVSKLVILHEEADDGNQMPDLSYPVQVVRKAADNLIKVGYETVETSNDIILKKELPAALKRVEQACNSLHDAALILKREPSSTNGKRELIAGERGILQGVSTILLTFDESEVRKILQVCRQVLEYLSITELIEKMDDLVTYVKNLTPILTKMTREINLREQELTHQIHVDLLSQHLNQVKELTPLFISSIKICLIISNNYTQTNNDHESPSLVSANQNKDYLIKRISIEIEEIIRILQLTTDDEDSWVLDDLSLIKQKFTSFEAKLKSACDWLNDKQAVCDSLGEKSLRNAFDDAQVILSKLNYDSDETIQNLKKLTDDLCQLITQGKRNTNMGVKKAALINDNIHQLKSKLSQIINEAQENNFKSAPTYYEKLEKAIKWFNNPFFDQFNGEEVSRLLLEESKQLAYETKDDDMKQKYLQLTYECEYLVNKLSQTVKADQKEEARSIGRQLNDKVVQVNNYLNRNLIQRIADDYLDVNYPIKKLNDLVMSASQEQNIKNLKDKFERLADDFLQHNHKLCNTAQRLANSTNQAKNKRNVELINELTHRNIEIAPQIVNSAYIVLSIPGNKSLTEHYDLMQQQWQSNMSNLQRLVDESLNSSAFIEAYEASILRETFQTQTAIQENNKQAIVLNALNIARRTNRIIQVASQEAENSEEISFVNNVNLANDELKQCLPPLVHAYKTIALQPNNKESFLKWTQTNEHLINSIQKVKESLNLNDVSSSVDQSSDIIYTSDIEYCIEDSNTTQEDLPDLDNLKINEEEYYVIESPIIQNSFFSSADALNLQDSTPSVEKHQIKQYGKVSKPTPLPDLVEEEGEIPMPKTNQPILMAAHDLHVNVNQWYSGDNDMIAVAKRITLLMAKLSSLVRRDENTNRKELIDTAKQLADESFEFTRISKLLAQDCTDKRMRTNLMQNCERIPTIGTQLKILSTVKATMLKGEIDGQMTKEDEEATEMLIFCAQNLNSSIKATMSAAKSASIKLKPDSTLKFRWIRKKKSTRV